MGKVGVIKNDLSNEGFIIYGVSLKVMKELSTENLK